MTTTGRWPTTGGWARGRLAERPDLDAEEGRAELRTAIERRYTLLA